MKNLVYLLKRTPNELKEQLHNYLVNMHMETISEDGFLYAKGNIPVLLVAHMDTVFSEPPKRILRMKNTDMLYNPDGGLGGDDRCGVYAIIELLKKYRPHVLFTEDEEIGCIGARKSLRSLDTPDVKYIIEFDRKGSEDCVFYECGNSIFQKYIEKYGFKTARGTCSDISVLGSGWDIAAVNLSSGYYNEHTENEYVIFNELLATIKKADRMLRVIQDVPYFNYQHERPRIFTFSGLPYYSDYRNYSKEYRKGQQR